VRISGGGARGIPLLVPKGDAVRPATDRLRQAVFSSLGARVTDCLFLDLFAGSGAYGLEALSRGAAGGTFVENNHRALGCLRQNLAAVCKSLERTEAGLNVLPMDAAQAPLGGSGPPDLVFIDPPYDVIAELVPGLFLRLGEMLRPRPDALVVFEMPGEMDFIPEGWTCRKRLGQGRRQPTAAIFASIRREGAPG
jgi:16S rRNA (guanine966-N2)-methyltransferase